jgi:hypothetical protein
VALDLALMPLRDSQALTQASIALLTMYGVCLADLCSSFSFSAVVALAFQLGSSVLGGFLIQELHPMRLSQRSFTP